MNWKHDPILRRLVQEKLPARYLGAEISHVEALPYGTLAFAWVTGCNAPIQISGEELYNAGWRPPPPVEENTCPSP